MTPLLQRALIYAEILLQRFAKLLSERGPLSCQKKELKREDIMLLKHHGILRHKTEYFKTALKKTRPAAENVLAELLDQFSSKVRPD